MVPASQVGRVLVEIDPPIARIVFDHPGRLNAVTRAMCRDLDAAVAEIESNGAVRAVVAQGAGDRAFVVGSDIRGVGQSGEDGFSDDVYRSQYHALARLPQPVIAMIRGYCVGGGLFIALDADVRIASDDARFRVPAARLGVGPPPDEVARLVRNIGPSATAELLLLAEEMDAARACAVGLVNRVVRGEQLDEVVKSIAEAVAANAPLSLAAAKAGIAAAIGLGQTDTAQRLVDACEASNDLQEGRAAFLDKRPARFTGR